MSSEHATVRQVAMPTQCAVATLYPSPHLADAYAIDLPPGTSRDPDVLWRFVMSHQPAWIRKLTNLRDMIVGRFGLKTARELVKHADEPTADRISFFKVYRRSQAEILVGEDDKHLDFRLSVMRTPDSSAAPGGQLIVSTVVHCHNALGRAYIRVIAPFHREVVKASLRRAAEMGWPARDTT